MRLESMLRLAENDKKAWDWIANNFSICSHEHILSRKLWMRFASYKGPVFAIKPNCVDLNQLHSYMEIWWPPGDTPNIKNDPVEDRPKTQIVEFVKDYLKSSDDAVVVCENANATRKMYENWEWGELPPYWCYGDKEVYHILTRRVIGTNKIYNSIREAFVSWGVGVCTSCKIIPDKSITDDSFFDEIVRNTRHIFLPAFDGDGFLVWTPQRTSNEP